MNLAWPASDCASDPGQAAGSVFGGDAGSEYRLGGHGCGAVAEFASGVVAPAVDAAVGGFGEAVDVAAGDRPGC
jgi:hypothetical protein